VLRLTEPDLTSVCVCVCVCVCVGGVLSAVWIHAVCALLPVCRLLPGRIGEPTDRLLAAAVFLLVGSLLSAVTLNLKIIRVELPFYVVCRI